MSGKTTRVHGSTTRTIPSETASGSLTPKSPGTHENGHTPVTVSTIVATDTAFASGIGMASTLRVTRTPPLGDAVTGTGSSATHGATIAAC